MDTQHTDDQWSSAASFLTPATDVHTSTSLTDPPCKEETGPVVMQAIPTNTATDAEKIRIVMVSETGTPSVSGDGDTPHVSGDTSTSLVSSDAPCTSSDLTPTLVPSDATTQTLPSHSVSTVSTPAQSDRLVPSGSGGQHSLTQPQLIEVVGQDLHMLVKQELTEEDRREVEGWVGRGIGGTECEEDMDGLCVHPSQIVQGWKEEGCVRGVMKREEEKGEDVPVMMPVATTVVPSGTASSVSRWSHADTLRLIQLYKENRHYFDDKQIKKKTVWTMLAGKLARGSKSKARFSCTQVYNRWKNLTKTYRDCLEDIQRVGTWVGKCRFFEEMASVYDTGSSPELDTTTTTTTHRTVRKRRYGTTQPTRSNQAGGSFRAIAPKVLAPVQGKTSTGSVSAESSSVGRVEGGVGGRGGGGLEGVVRAVCELHEEEKARDEWKMSRLEHMHREKMDMFAQFLDILKGQKIT